MGESYGKFASVYDTLMRDADYAGWSAYLMVLLEDHGGAHTVLDCACGTGEFAIRLAREGYSVTGLDASDDMLRVAQDKARAQGLTIPFVCQDMRRLSLHRPVDALLCACDGVNYLTGMADVRAFFKSAAAAIKPGGLFLFDISSRYKLERVLGGNTFGEAGEDCTYLWRNRYDEKSRLCEMELTCFVKRGTLYGRFDERHVQRAHSVRELTGALEAAGFGRVAVYAAFTKESPMPETERIQFCAVRI